MTLRTTALVVACLSLTACAAGETAPPTADASPSITAGASTTPTITLPSVATPTASASPTRQPRRSSSATPTPPLREQVSRLPAGAPTVAVVRRWCDENTGLPKVSGPTDRMVPNGARWMVVCHNDAQEGRPVHAIVVDRPTIARVTRALNERPEHSADTSCTLVGGGVFVVVFATASRRVNVSFDRFNCVDAWNGRRSAADVQPVISMIDEIVESPGTIEVTAKRG